ncbi:MAG: hypothetical protein R3A48_11990 [Polyangiales bacterium]
MRDRIVWTDGARWGADDASFGALRRQLDGLRDSVMGLDPVLDRWPADGAATSIDEIAPSEADRAVLTAATLRALDEVEGLSDASLGLEGEAPRRRYTAALGELAALMQTDVTW